MAAGPWKSAEINTRKSTAQSESPITTQACKGGTVTAEVTRCQHQDGHAGIDKPRGLRRKSVELGQIQRETACRVSPPRRRKVVIDVTGCVFPPKKKRSNSRLLPSGVGEGGGRATKETPTSSGATVALWVAEQTVDLKSGGKRSSIRCLYKSGKLRLEQGPAVTSDGKCKPGSTRSIATKVNCGEQTRATLEDPAGVIDLELELPAKHLSKSPRAACQKGRTAKATPRAAQSGGRRPAL